MKQPTLREIKVFSPKTIRERVQHWAQQKEPEFVEEKVKRAVIHQAIGKSIKSALGQYDYKTGKFDYTKKANEEASHIRRLVLGFLTLSDDSILVPVSSNDETVITPQAINGLSLWHSKYYEGKLYPRTAFNEELLLVIHWARECFKLTEQSIAEGNEKTLSECLNEYEEKSPIYRGDETPLTIYWNVEDFRVNYVEARGPELLEKAKQAQDEIQQDTFEQGLEEQAVEVAANAPKINSDLDDYF